MIIADKVEQGSEEWYRLRKGRATASEFSKILTPTGKLSKQSIGYMRKLARECVCDDPMVFMGNKYTEWGNEMEPRARELFEEITGIATTQVGFVIRADNAPIGCSPDSLIPDGAGGWLGGLEIKCPSVDTHVGYLMDGVLPDEYKLQVHGSMAVTDLPYWFFMSYFPGLRPLIIRVERDDFTQLVSTALDEFIISYAAERQKVIAIILPAREESII